MFQNMKEGPVRLDRDGKNDQRCAGEGEPGHVASLPAQSILHPLLPCCVPPDLPTPLASVTYNLLASGFWLGSTSVVRVDQKMLKRSVLIFLSFSFLLQQHGSGSSLVPLWPL